MSKQEEDEAWHEHRCEYYLKQASNVELTKAERVNYADKLHRLLLAL